MLAQKTGLKGNKLNCLYVIIVFVAFKLADLLICHLIKFHQQYHTYRSICIHIYCVCIYM